MMLRTVNIALLVQFSVQANFYKCKDVAFCSRFRQFETEILAKSFERRSHEYDEDDSAHVMPHSRRPQNARKLSEASTATNANPAKYAIDGGSVKVSGNTIEAVIQANEDLPVYSKAAEHLQLTISFYQNGIARITIDEFVNIMEKRFRISDEKDFAVMQDQLI